MSISSNARGVESENLMHRLRNKDFGKWGAPPLFPKAYMLVVEMCAKATQLCICPSTLPSRPSLCQAVVMRQMFHVSEQTVQQGLGGKIPVLERKGLLIPVQVEIPSSIAEKWHNSVLCCAMDFISLYSSWNGHSELPRLEKFNFWKWLSWASVSVLLSLTNCFISLNLCVLNCVLNPEGWTRTVVLALECTPQSPAGLLRACSWAHPQFQVGSCSVPFSKLPVLLMPLVQGQCLESHWSGWYLISLWTKKCFAMLIQPGHLSNVASVLHLWHRHEDTHFPGLLGGLKGGKVCKSDKHSIWCPECAQ